MASSPQSADNVAALSLMKLFASSQELQHQQHQHLGQEQQQTISLRSPTVYNPYYLQQQQQQQQQQQRCYYVYQSDNQHTTAAAAASAYPIVYPAKQPQPQPLSPKHNKVTMSPPVLLPSVRHLMSNMMYNNEAALMDSPVLRPMSLQYNQMAATSIPGSPSSLSTVSTSSTDEHQHQQQQQQRSIYAGLQYQSYYHNLYAHTTAVDGSSSSSPTLQHTTTTTGRNYPTPYASYYTTTTQQQQQQQQQASYYPVTSARLIQHHHYQQQQQQQQQYYYQQRQLQQQQQHALSPQAVNPCSPAPTCESCETVPPFIDDEEDSSSYEKHHADLSNDNNHNNHNNHNHVEVESVVKNNIQSPVRQRFTAARRPPMRALLTSSSSSSSVTTTTTASFATPASPSKTRKASSKVRKTYKCEQCNETFETKSRYDKHMTYSLDHDPANIGHWPQCDKCNNKYHPDSFSRHVKTCGQRRSSKDKALFKIKHHRLTPQQQHQQQQQQQRPGNVADEQQKIAGLLANALVSTATEQRATGASSSGIQKRSILRERRSLAVQKLPLGGDDDYESEFETDSC